MAQVGITRRIPDPTKKSPPKPIIEEESFFDDNPGPADTRPSTIAESLTAPHTRTPTAIQVPAVLWPIAGIVAGLVLLAAGIYNAGGFYEQGSRLSGGLATFFYVWQIGNLLEIIGVIIAWENLKELKRIIYGTS